MLFPIPTFGGAVTDSFLTGWKILFVPVKYFTRHSLVRFHRADPRTP